MSRGKIIKHLGEAQYEVELQYAIDRLKAELTRINDRIAELAVLIPDKKLELIAAEDAARSVIASIDDLIPAYRDDPGTYGEEIKNLQIDLIEKQRAVSQLRFEVEQLIAEDLGLKKRRGQIDRIPEGKIIKAWCADYSDDLSGVVGLVNLNDEGARGTLIRPGFSDSAAYDSDHDGILMPREAQSAAQVYLNAAILPGVQKWMPRYRVGTISNIVADTCVVMLDEAESSAQGLNISQFRMYSDVPIQYMDCDGVAFESGDKVLVRFFDSGPQVVGFYQEPRPCTLPGFLFAPASYTNEGVITRYGRPITEENAPLGTAGGDRSGWILHPDPENYPYRILKGRAIESSGQTNWVGADDIHLSWKGPGNRAAIWGASGQKVFFRLRTVFDLSEHSGFGNHVVVGAGYDGTYLHVMSYSTSVTSAGGTLVHHRMPVDESLRSAGDRVTVQTIPLEAWQRLATGCYWSEDGANAVMTLVSITYDATSEEPGRFLDANQAAWEISVSSTGTSVVTEVYDSVENSDAAIISQTVTSTSASIEVAERMIPIYTDYVGNFKVTAYWREPGVIGSATFSESETSEKKTKTDDRSYSCSVPAAIVIGESEVVAENENTSAWSSNYFWERTYVDGGTDQLVYSGEMIGVDNLTDLGYIHEAIVSIDIRTKTVILAENKNDWNMAWDFSGAWEGPFNETYSGTPIPAGSRTSTVDSLGQHDGFLRWRVSAWVGGAKVAEFIDREAITFDESVYQREPGAGGISNYGPLMAPVGGNPSSSSTYGGPLQFGSASMGSDSAFSLLHERYDETVTGLSWVSKIATPVVDLFGQEPGDPFYFDELSLV